MSASSTATWRSCNSRRGSSSRGAGVMAISVIPTMPVVEIPISGSPGSGFLLSAPSAQAARASGGAAEGEGEVAGRVGPPGVEREAGGGELVFDPLPGELGAELGAHRLAGPDLDGEVEPADVDGLVTVGPEPHLDPLLVGVPVRHVGEAVRVEVSVEGAVHHVEHIAVEL